MSKLGEYLTGKGKDKETSEVDETISRLSNTKTMKANVHQVKRNLDKAIVKQNKEAITYQDYITKLNSKYGKKLEFVASVGGNMVVNYHNHVVLRVSLTTTDDPLIKYDDFDLEYFIS